jgi:8-oxo-dGTP diphosphatase
MADVGALPSWPSPRAYGVAVCESRVLLVRARSRRANGEEVWWLPGGGVHFLETPVAALSREFREETGLGITDAELLDVVSDTWVRRNGEVAHAIRIIYRVGVTPGPLAHEGAGSTDLARWFGLEALPDAELAPYAADAIARATHTK